MTRFLVRSCRFFLAQAVFCLCLFSSLAVAGVKQWKLDTAVSKAPGDQGLFQLAIAPDDNHGAVIVWQDRPRSLVFARRVDNSGTNLWSARLVGLSPFEKFYPAVVEDGTGGVITAWVEGREGFCSAGFQGDCDVYAQRLGASGQRLWNSDGEPVVKAGRNQGISGIAVVSDGMGGAFLAWEDARPPDCCKVYAQHLGADGKPLWSEDGIRVSPEPSIVIGPMDAPPQMVSDGNGGVLIAWINNQVHPVYQRPTLNVQRLSAAGQTLWPEGGVAVGEPSHVSFRLASDGMGGALLAFTMTDADGFADAAVQKVAPDGVPLWGEQGTRAATANYYHEAPEIVADNRGGAIVAWVDHLYDPALGTQNSDIRAQRIAADGSPLWSPMGRVICNLPGVQDNVRMTGDGNGGALLVWKDCRDYLDRDSCFESANLYGQHILPDDRLAWPLQGAPISKIPGTQGVPQGTPVHHGSIMMTSDREGGAILAWPDGRNGFCANAVFTTECDVYAQRIADEVSPPAADLLLRLSGVQGGAGGDIVFTVKVKNLGPNVASGVKVVIPFPGNSQFSAISANGVVYGHTLLFRMNVLNPEETKTAWFSIKPLAIGNICASGTAYSEVMENQSANNKMKTCVLSQ